MLRSVLLLLLLVSSLSSFSQSFNSCKPSVERVVVNVNDTTYMRILDGVVLPNTYVVDKFERFSVKSKDSFANFEGKGAKSIMIIGLSVSELEHQIHQKLYSQEEFIAKYKFPLDIRLPLAVNNKLLSNTEKSALLAKISFSNIKNIEYLDPKSQKVNASLTPYGVINLKI